jgi:hypothetical protein
MRSSFSASLMDMAPPGMILPGNPCSELKKQASIEVLPVAVKQAAGRTLT